MELYHNVSNLKSEDEDGDMYESYNNSVWEYIEEEVQL